MAPVGTAIDQNGNLASRGVPPSVVKNAILNGQSSPQNDGTIIYTYQQVQVVTNAKTGYVVTVINGSNK